MMITNYKEVFEKIVRKTRNYVEDNNLQSMILGISGGIDSTVVAAICREVSEQTGIPLIGRSLTIVNKKEEFSLARKVGEAFCDDFKEVYLWDIYNEISGVFKNLEMYQNTPISEGNIMARLRMIYLYNLAGIHKGLVMDTDNLTEHYLGFWTIHGDEGDYNPIGGLWKTEVYGLSNWLHNEYYSDKSMNENKLVALLGSIEAIPTDGNGISSSDLEQIGGKDYYEVDKILVPLVMEGWNDEILEKFNPDVVKKIWNRYKNSGFKRKTSRVIKIERDELL